MPLLVLPFVGNAQHRDVAVLDTCEDVPHPSSSEEQGHVTPDRLIHAASHMVLLGGRAGLRRLHDTVALGRSDRGPHEVRRLRADAAHLDLKHCP